MAKKENAKPEDAQAEQELVGADTVVIQGRTPPGDENPPRLKALEEEGLEDAPNNHELTFAEVQQAQRHIRGQNKAVAAHMDLLGGKGAAARSERGGIRPAMDSATNTLKNNERGKNENTVEEDQRANAAAAAARANAKAEASPIKRAWE